MVGFFAPAKTPAHIIQKLNTEMVAALRAPELKALLETNGLEAVGSSPEARRGLTGGVDALGADSEGTGGSRD